MNIDLDFEMHIYFHIDNQMHLFDVGNQQCRLHLADFFPSQRRMRIN